ncbi:ATP-dependent Clp protease ATP-binding subunit [Patescibacteria group bacterium]|nr:ATP-dependent Clp protease ATP-binding subunit [Patescibacteria group bacterium]
MLFKYLGFLLLQFPRFYFRTIPQNLFHFFGNYLYELDSFLSLRLNINLFFVPLFGYGNWALRIASVLYRVYKILLGLLIILFYILLFIATFLLIIFSPFYYLYSSFQWFLFFACFYYFLYYSYYFFSPFDLINYKNSKYSLLDLYKMADFNGRNTLEDLMKNKNVLKQVYLLSVFLEKPADEINTFLNFKIEEEAVCDSVISLGIFSDYRHINSNLLVCGFLNTNEKFIEYLEKNNLPKNSLKTFLLIHKKSYSLNSPKIYEVDYKSHYVFPYNNSKLDRVSHTLDKYSFVFAPKVTSLAISHLKSFQNNKTTLIKTLSGDNKKALIMGDPGIGKTSLVEDFYNDIRLNKIPSNLKYNRILSLDLSQIVSLGVNGPEILSNCLKEFLLLKNTILFIDNLHILYNSKQDYTSIMLEYFENPHLKIIATTDRQTFLSKVSKDSSINNIFTKIVLQELSGLELFDFLTIKNWDLQKKLTIPAIDFLTQYSSQVMFTLYNPQKSLKIIEQASLIASTLISKEVLSSVIKTTTGISLGEINETEQTSLLDLKTVIKKEVIGQEAAVDEVVSALIRSRGLRNNNSNKPIASFLFAGPTGVGKTELAKSLSRNYFKGEGNIIRLDMSEYQTSESINRLIGSEDGKKFGLLTESIKEQPFNLLLLDEIEKASKNIQMLFLQVLDDGRLTDSSGVTVSFKNIIIIATTNAGTSNVIDDFSRGDRYEDVRNAFLINIKKNFPPEFLNRFTEIVLFSPLNREIFEEVMHLKFNKIKQAFYEEHKINITLGSTLQDHLVALSYSKEWGARSLERVLEKTVTTAVSKALIMKEIEAGQSIVIDKEFVAKYTS